MNRKGTAQKSISIMLEGYNEKRVGTIVRVPFSRVRPFYEQAVSNLDP